MATSGDLLLATTGDFFMAGDIDGALDRERALPGTGRSSRDGSRQLPRELRMTFETLISRRFRDCAQLCSGLVDLVLCVGCHGSGAHHFACTGERFVGRVAEDIAQVGDRGADSGTAAGRGLSANPAMVAAGS